MPGKSSIGFSGFKKLAFLVEISKISEFLKKSQIHRGRRSCSTSYPSGNLVDGSPLVAVELGQSGAAHADAHDHENVVLEKNIIDKCSRE